MIALSHVKVGDKVLLGLTAKAPSTIATVTRLTKTMILLTPPGALVEHRYERETGCEVGSRALGLRIKGIATPEEAAAIEHRLAEKQRRLRQADNALEASRIKRRELADLFPGEYSPASVTESMDFPGQWALTLEPVSEQDIKELADFMHMPEYRFRT